MNTPLIEAIARAIMRHHDIDPDVFVGMHGGYGDWIDAAQAALTAITEAGYRIIPSPITGEEMDAAIDAEIEWMKIANQAAQGDGE